MHEPPSDPAAGPGAFEYRFSPRVANIRLSRHVLANWLEMQPGVDPDAIDDLLVVCSELVTNAILHAPGHPEHLCLRAETDGDAVVLEVEDRGRGFAWPVSHALSDVLADEEHGRGLFIVEALTDRLGVLKTNDDRTIVRCVKFDVLRHDAGGERDLSRRFRAESPPPRHHERSSR
jgi:anti-sigma regulatory factor (Ser/Thr protein kinase)